MVNMTCPTIPDKPADPKPFFENGQIDFKAHDVGWLVCGIMALVATISSAWLIWKHLTYYTCPQQQRHIVRLLIMVPIYAIVSFMSYLFYHEALYYQTIRDCYEAVLVTSFFYLILAYTGDTRAEQHAVFRNIDLGDRFWVWPFGSWKYRPDGLHFLWLMKIWVLQYAIIRPLCTFIAVGTEYFGYYCLHSWMPWFTHVWCALFISISVSVAMYCLIQLYMPVRKLVDPYKPILKFLSIKTIVFLTFWQDTLLSFLVSFGAIKETEYFTAEQIQAGINALLQCFWMLLFGFIHIKAFSYLPYRPEDRSRTTLRGKALLDSLDFRDWFWEMKESTRYIAARSKGKNYTLAEDLRAKRHEHLLNALGKQRTANLEAEIDVEKANMPTFWKNPEDAQFWSPHSEETQSAFDSNHRSSKTSSRPTSGSTDAYSALPNPVARHSRTSSKLAPSHGQRPTTADSHTMRAAELQRLVAELDLQQVDASTVLAGGRRDNDLEDGNNERTALMHDGAGSREKAHSNEADPYPELTQYHAPTIQLANVPSLSYDADTQSSGARRTLDLSAVAEEDEDESHTRQPSRIAPGVGAFGIAAWLGWNGNPAPQQQQNAFLHPGTAEQQHGMPSPEADGKGWWRNYWERVSNPGSREPSIAGIDDEEKEPLTAANRPAVMRQVTAGSWGTDNVLSDTHPPQGEQQDGVNHRSLPPLPPLQIDTAGQSRDARRAGSSDSATSPSSRISPHADSPLSRLIQTSRDSFSSLNRDEIRAQLDAPPLRPRLAEPIASRPGERREVGPAPATVQNVAPARPAPAPRQMSFAPSSKQASVSRVTSTTRSGANSSSKHATSVYESAASTAARQMAEEMTTSADSKHRIVFADALVPDEQPAEEAAVVPAKKTLPPAVGPKGKLFSLVLPSPLSPARYPYGTEGPAQPVLASAPTAVEPSAVRQPSAAASASVTQAGAGGSLRWATQPAKPLKPSEERAPEPAPKLPTKGVITVGGMSLAQAKAQAQAEAQAQSQAQAQVQVQRSERGAEPSKRTEGKLVLPAPSTMARGEAEDPYRAGALAHTPQREPQREPRRAVADGRSTTTAATRTSMSTAFEVGSIVPRHTTHQQHPPLSGYYSSVRQNLQPVQRYPHQYPQPQHQHQPHPQPQRQPHFRPQPLQHPQHQQRGNAATQFHFEYYRD